MQMAISLVFELRLNRPLIKDLSRVSNLCSLGYAVSEIPIVARTMDDRRAVLGCFVLSSMYVSFFTTGHNANLCYLRVSLYFAKIDALRWSPYMDECLQVIAESGNADDDLLVHQVRLQLISERVMHASWNDGGIEHGESSKATPTFYLKALQNQLNQFKRSLPAHLQVNSV